MAVLKQTWAALAVLGWGSTSVTGSFFAADSASMPTNPDDVRPYADLLRRDVDSYLVDVE